VIAAPNKRCFARKKIECIELRKNKGRSPEKILPLTLPTDEGKSGSENTFTHREEKPYGRLIKPRLNPD
jgi:hypothetical protein